MLHCSQKCFHCTNKGLCSASRHTQTLKLGEQRRSIGVDSKEPHEIKHKNLTTDQTSTHYCNQGAPAMENGEKENLLE